MYITEVKKAVTNLYYILFLKTDALRSTEVTFQRTNAFRYIEVTV
jgi:hypothetical protein